MLNMPNLLWMARQIYIISWVYLTKIYACNIPTKNHYNAEKSVIILSHLYRVSTSVYPKIPVGAANDLAFNLLDHNVVVCVRSTSLTKYVTHWVPWSTHRSAQILQWMTWPEAASISLCTAHHTCPWWNCGTVAFHGNRFPCSRMLGCNCLWLEGSHSCAYHLHRI